MISSYETEAVRLFRITNEYNDTSVSRRRWNGDVNVISEVASKWLTNELPSDEKSINQTLEEFPHVIDCALSYLYKSDDDDDDNFVNEQSVKEKNIVTAVMLCAQLTKYNREEYRKSSSYEHSDIFDKTKKCTEEEYNYRAVRIQYLGIDGLRRLYSGSPKKLDGYYKDMFSQNMYLFKSGQYARTRIIEHIIQHGIKSETQKNILLAGLKDSGIVQQKAFEASTRVIKNVSEYYTPFNSPIPFLEYAASVITSTDGNKKEKLNNGNSNDRYIGILNDFRQNAGSVKDIDVIDSFIDICGKVDTHLKSRQKIENEKQARVKKYGKFLGRLSFLPV